MTSFSERYGYIPVRDSLQIEKIEKDTRYRIWNLLDEYFFCDLRAIPRYHEEAESASNIIFLRALWHNFFRKSISRLTEMTQYQIYQNLEGFIFKAEWFKIYDFIENVITFYKKDDDCKKFIEHCNILLEEDACAYRIIGEQVVKLTSDEEIAEVEKVLETPFDPIKTHITKSLQFLSDRTTPDYHNSIKESISAVECICQIIAEDRNASLGKALKLLETKGFELNPVLFEGLQKLYGYTNTEDGVRHAMMEVDTVDQDDALFMLVICSAFVNYLKVEASKIGIDLMANYNTITGN